MKDSRTIVTRLREDYPAPTEHFRSAVRETLENQLEGFSGKPEKRRKQRWKQRWAPVLAAAALLCTGAGVIAQTAGKELLKTWLRTEDEKLVEQYTQDGVEVTVELKDTPFKEPLWLLSDFWYDGASLAFTAASTEEGRKYSTGSDHIYINGQDCLMNVNSEQTGGSYLCWTEVNQENDAGKKLEVELPLKAWDTGDNHLVGQQTYRFAVEQAGKVRNAEEGVYPLENGEVQVHEIEAAVSGVTLDFTYRFHGEDAQQKVKELWGVLRISDSSGTEGKIHSVGVGDIYQDGNGNWCRHISVEDAKGMDSDSPYYDINAYTWDTDGDGKRILGTERDLDYGNFRILMN